MPTERSSALQASTLCEAFQLTAAQFADRVALRTPGDTQSLTWREFAAAVERVAGGLAELGVGPGDTVALMMTNRLEFSIVDTAALHLGATPFSIYNSSAPEQIEYLFSNADNKVVVAERQFVDVIRAARGDLTIVVVEDGLPEADHPDFEGAWRAVEPSDIATLIYTSGTTGPPKGVQLSHASLLVSLRGWTDVGFGEPAGRRISYLPLGHIADRLTCHYSSLVVGSTLTFVNDPSQVLAALVETRPTGWLAMPRIWEKIKASLEAKGFSDPMALPAEVKAGIRDQLGLDQAVWLGCGAAPVAPSVLEYFMALDLPICDIWGMSETSCAGTANRPGSQRVGTVGTANPGVELRVADDGELLMRSAANMVGYRKEPEKTAETIDADGWLHTGDVVTMDDDGYVTIVDRKKELIISAGGKNMSPANIEQALKTSHPLIGQACCIGDARPYNVALLVLDPDVGVAFAAANSLDDASLAVLSVNPEVRATVAAAVEEANSHLSRPEQIKKFLIVGEDWLPDSDVLTPTMKLKRRGVNEKYAAEIEAMYAS